MGVGETEGDRDIRSEGILKCLQLTSAGAYLQQILGA